MEKVLVMLYLALIVLNTIDAGRNFSNNKPGIATIDIVCAVMWGMCLVVKLGG